MLAVFVFAVKEAHGWPREAALLTLAFGYTGMALTGVILFYDIQAFLHPERGARAGSIISQYAGVLRESKEPRKILMMYGWFGFIVLVTYVGGQMLSLPLYVFLFLKFVARESWKVILIYTFCSWLLLWGMFGEIIHVIWQPPWLDFMPQ